ncbi:MAG: SH3 domain-containing protein, partial [Clostridia bacterium]|nr:SH3 domain-containing protein [Clostridia bacterium]
LSVDFYGSNLSDLSEAEAWATKNIGAEITKYDVKVNGMNAIEYHYVVTDKEGNTAFADVLFIENENDKIIEFWEKTFDEERTGKLSSEIYPISLFDDYIADNQNQEASAEQTEAAPASDTATESYSGTCTADKVNLREEAKANARSIGQINRGEKLVVLETEGEWTKVRCSKGEGYIKTQYIKMQ